MKITTCSVFIICFALVAAVPRASAQEYFNRIATPEDIAPVAPVTPTATATATENPEEAVPEQRMEVTNPQPTPESSEKYNMALGNFHFGLAAGVGLEYNDNVNLAPRGQQIADFAFRPSATLDATYALSELNTLRFSLGASYAAYFNHSEFDTRGVLLSPSSELALTVHVASVVLTFRDRFSYEEDPFDNPTISNTAVYRRYENQVGVQADWAMNDKTEFAAGYEHYNLWAEDPFNYLTRSVDTIYLKPSYQIAPAVKVGLDGSVSFVRFEENIQNNGTNYMVGPFVDAALTQNTHLYAEGGYQYFHFDDNGTIGDTSNSSTWYARLELANRLSENFTQRLSFTKSTEVGGDTLTSGLIGGGSNFYVLYHVEYAIDWKLTQNLSLDPSLFYEHYTTSAAPGVQGETADRYGAAIGLRYILTPSITLGLDYRYIYKTSNLPDFGYQQNLVLLSAYYNF